MSRKGKRQMASKVFKLISVPVMGVAMTLSAAGAHAAWIKAGSAAFDVAMEKIVPLPYKIEIDANVKNDIQIAWGDGDNWMEVLRNAISPLGLSAAYDMDRGVVVITRDENQTVAPAKAGSRVSRHPSKSAHEIAAAGRSSDGNGAQTEQKRAENRSRALVMEPGDVISDKLSAWLGGYGYTLYWDAPKYRVKGPVNIMKSVDDTLKEIVSIMEANGVKLVAEVYTNGVVRVTGSK
jgi:hypothetical protein